jgi:hypothetical protein
MTDMIMPDLPQPTPPAPKKSNKTLIIIIAVVVVLCCLCAIVGGVIYFVTKDSGGVGSLFGGGTTDITGDWVVHYSWDCTGTYSTGTLAFYSDDTFNVDSDATLWGTWTLTGDNVDFMFDEYPNTHYIGALDSTGDYMSGTMDNADAMTGCWYADR